MRTLRQIIFIILTLVVGMQSGLTAEVILKANDDTITDVIVRAPFTINTLVDNDTSSGGPIFLFATSKPQYGAVEIRPGNVIIYSPSYVSFRGEDTFSYVISSQPNGAGAISQATVTILNPYYRFRGAYSAAIVGEHETHDESGYLALNVDPYGAFTARLHFAGLTHSFKGEFDANGHYTASIVRTPPLAGLKFDIQFPLDGSSDIQCELTNGAQVTTFTAALSTWSKNNPPPLKGRYTFVLPAPNALASTPQGNGYGTISIGTDGTASISGHTGDNRGFTSSSKLSEDGIVPLYAGLYNKLGSIYGEVSLQSVAQNTVALNADLKWSKPRTPKVKFFPRGFLLTIEGRGSNYIEPEPNSGILVTESSGDFNSTFTVSSGIFRVPKTERANLGSRPDSGTYGLFFDNKKRLHATMSITPRTGSFSGYFTDVKTHRKYRMGGVFVQGENAAYGLWSSPTRTGRVLLLPDPLPETD